MFADRTSRWTLGTALLCVLVLVAAWFLLVSPRRGEAAELREQAASQEGQVTQLQAEIARLTQQFGDLDRRRAELAAVRAQLPPSADVPRLVRLLEQNASAAGVDLTSVTPSAAVALTDSAGAAVASGVQQVPVSINLTGSYVEAALFLKYVQTRLQRAFLVTGINVAVSPNAVAATPTPTTGSSGALADVSMSINGEVFVLPQAATPTASASAAATAAPAAGATTAPGAAATTAPTTAPTAGSSAGATEN